MNNSRTELSTHAALQALPRKVEELATDLHRLALVQEYELLQRSFASDRPLIPDLSFARVEGRLHEIAVELWPGASGGSVRAAGKASGGGAVPRHARGTR